MNRKIMMRTSVVILIAFAIILFSSGMVQAGSYSVSGGGTIKVGGTSTITVKGTSLTGQFEFSSSDPSVVSINKSAEWMEGGSNISITATAKKAGKATITIKATNVADSSTGEDMQSSSKTVTITVEEKTTTPSGGGSTGGNSSSGSNANTNTNTNNNSGTTTTKKSSDATLKSLSVNQEGLTPEFNKNTTSYTLNVNGDIDRIEVNAKANDSNAKVRITGNEELQEGENTVKVIVTAEDGSTKTYSIKVIRAQKIKLGLETLSIEGIKLSPAFRSEITSYKTLLVKPEIETLEVLAKANKENAIVEITGNENLKEGENVISITVKSKDGEESITYEIAVNKLPADMLYREGEEQPQETKDSALFSFIPKQLRPILIVAFTAIIALAGIVFAVIEYRYKKKESIENTVQDIENSDEEEIGFTPKFITDNEELAKEEADEEKKEEITANLSNNRAKWKRSEKGGKHF